MTNEVDYSIINELSEEDIEVISKNIDLDILLHPIKHNTKYYKRYTRRLGRMDKKSPLVRKNMPKIASELYYKEDDNYYHIFATKAMKLKQIFQEIIEKELKENIDLIDLEDYSVDEYISLLTQIEKVPGNNVNIQLFILQLKMNEIELDQEKQVILFYKWKHHSKVKQLKEKFQIEKELLIKDQEIYTNSQLKDQKNQFETLLIEKENNEKRLSKDIEDKEGVIATLEKEITDKNTELTTLEIGNSQNIEHVKSLQQECSKFMETIEGLQNILNKQNEEYYEELKNEWKKRNFVLIKEKLDIEEQIDAKKKIVDELTKKENELLISLERLQIMMDSYVADIEKQMTNKLVEATVERINESNTPKQRLCSDNLSELYIIDGCSVEEYSLLGDNDDFLDMIESNLENIGCKMKSTDFIDNINAAINSNLAPLLCGFGTRKVAAAFIAARYAENPTVISIPNGFTNVRQLEFAINDAPTHCVIIEDAFGKMSENMVLPILRNNLKKQLIFCCEDLENLRYLDKYYYNYFKLIIVTRMRNSNLEKLRYGDAEAVFKNVEYDNKSIGHQLVRYLTGEIDLLDTYKITRGNMISYLIEELNYQKAKVIQMWVKQELGYLLTHEQREKVLEIIENSDAFLEDNL